MVPKGAVELSICKKIPMIFEDSIFFGNSETGLYIDGTFAHFQDLVSFDRNTVLLGGGIHLFRNALSFTQICCSNLKETMLFSLVVLSITHLPSHNP